MATFRRCLCFGARDREGNGTGFLILAVGLFLLASGTTCLTPYSSLAQQSPATQPTPSIEGDPSPDASDAPAVLPSQLEPLPSSALPDTAHQQPTKEESPADTWPEETDPLEGLFDDTARQPTQPHAPTRPNTQDAPFDEIKSLLKDIDPRESLDFELPESLQGSAATDHAPGEDETSSSGETVQPSGAAGSYGAGDAVPNAPRQSQTTIGELQDLVVDVFSDFRIYAYLLLSLGAVFGLFAITIVVKRSRARRDRSRSRHRGRRRSRRRLAHS